MAGSPEMLRDLFRDKREGAIMRCIEIWDDQDIEDRKTILWNMLYDLVEESLYRSCSEDMIAKEVRYWYEVAELQISADEAFKKVTQVSASFKAKLRPEEWLCNYESRPSASLGRRLSKVSCWSDDSAFLFDIPALDEITGGVQPGEMMALSGAQGSMKSSLLLNGIENALSRGMKVIFFSLDMTPGEIQERRLQRRIKCRQYELHEMVRRKDPALRKVIDEMTDWDRLRFDMFGNDNTSSPESGDWNIDELSEQVKAAMPDVLAIDYLTLLRRPKQSDLECVNEVMPKLKRLTQSFDIRTIVLSQMGRASKREQFSGIIGGHAKGGGIVEEMVHSEIELFKDVPVDDNEPAPIIASVTKNRRGPSGRSYRLYYDPKCMWFNGASVRVERANKQARKRAFESPAMVGANAPISESHRERSYK